MHSPQFFQATLDSLQTTIAIIDARGRILFVNRCWREFAANNGADPAAVSEGSNYFAVCETSAAGGCVEARSFIEQATRVLQRELTVYEMEYPCHGPARQRWFQVRVTLLQHEGEGRAVVCHEEITPIKLAEKELKNRQAFLHSIIDASPNLVFVKDDNGRYLLANKTVAAMYGMTPEEMVGRDDVEIMRSQGLPVEEEEKFQQDDRGVFERRETVLIEKESFTDHRGTQRWFRSIKSPVVIDGRPRYLIGIANDITRDREQQQAIRNAQLRLQTILNTIHQEVVLFDTTAGVVWANDIACRRVGLSLSEVVGRSCNQVYCHHRHAAADCPVTAVLKTGQTQERAFVAEQGSALSVTVRPVVDDRRVPIGAVLVAEDITRRLSLEQQLRQAQKLESLGTLAGGIAHDFNNILTAVLGFTELCLGRAANDPVMKEDLEEVYQASLRARELVHQILTFSRRVGQEMRPLDITLIVKEVLKLLRSTLPSTIEIKSRVAKDIGLVRADPTRIHQVLMNLCTNAAHAMREEGGVLSLSLTTRPASADDRLRHHQLVAGRTYVRLEISDTGCGMDKKTIPLIFDPYYTTKEQGEGTGLGLALVHGIVREYNGAVDVVSAPGEGATFIVYLPQYRGEPEEPVIDGSEELLHGDGEQLLVVDDELGITRLCRRILEGAGYRVHVENDSLKALAYLRAKAKDIDLLISDMTMPSLTGEKLAQEVRRTVPDLPIILISGNSPRLPVSLEDSEAIELLAKPIDRDRLLGVIQALLGKSARS